MRPFEADRGFLTSLALLGCLAVTLFQLKAFRAGPRPRGPRLSPHLQASPALPARSLTQLPNVMINGDASLPAAHCPHSEVQVAWDPPGPSLAVPRCCISLVPALPRNGALGLPGAKPKCSAAFAAPSSPHGVFWKGRT